MDAKLIIVNKTKNINPHPDLNPFLVSRFSYALWINSQKIPHDCRVDNRFEPFRFKWALYYCLRRPPLSWRLAHYSERKLPYCYCWLKFLTQSQTSQGKCNPLEYLYPFPHKKTRGKLEDCHLKTANHREHRDKFLG